MLHRRRIKTEEKANVVASVCWEEFIHFHVALAILHGTILNNKKNSFFFQINLVQFILLIKFFLGKTASAARNLINSSPQTEVTTFAFSSFFYSSLWDADSMKHETNCLNVGNCKYFVR